MVFAAYGCGRGEREGLETVVRVLVALFRSLHTITLSMIFSDFKRRERKQRKRKKTHPLIPSPRLPQIYAFPSPDPHFPIVPHGEFRAREPCSGSSVCENECQAFVLLEDAFGSAEEPFAEGEVGFGLSGTGGEGVVLDGE